MKEIPSSFGKYSFQKMEPLEKGWSSDKKFRVVTVEGQVCLLRVSAPEELERKREEFEALRSVAALGLPVPRPLAFGLSPEGGGVFTLLTWAEGREAKEALPFLCEKEQYRLGCEAGKILRAMHTLPAPPGVAPWEERFSRKMERKIEMYENCPIQAPGGEKIVRYLRENKGLLRGRPQTFQHGDYHCGNMVLGGDNRLSVIDFNRFDYGDPWEEFNRIVWCASVSGAFAAGRVEGYFGGEAPELFWRLLALYIGSNTLSSIPWAIPFGEKEVEVMLRQTEEVLTWFQDMENPVPSWYREWRERRENVR